jgi:hypothetical protein
MFSGFTYVVLLTDFVTTDFATGGGAGNSYPEEKK